MTGLLERVSVPRRLEATALCVYAVVFALLVEYGRPGLGISQGFYLGIVLFALAGGPVSGAAAGVLATLLWAIASTIHGTFFGEALEPLGIRLASFTLAGFAVGYFARRGRQMLAESLHVLDDVLRIARRDVATGVLAPDGLSASIAQRVDRSDPFAVLVGELTTSSDAARREELRTLAAALDGESEVARVGRLRVAVVTAARSPEDASRIAVDLERVLGGVTFGWAFHPLDGDEPLTLFGAASERRVETAVVLVSTG